MFDDALPNSSFNRNQTGGFRDAKTDDFISYSNLKILATYLATAMNQHYGITKGSHVTLFCSNSIWYPVATFATVRLGAIVTGSSPEYGVDEMAYILSASESDLVFADNASFDVVCKAADKVGLGMGRVVLLGSPAEVQRATGTGNWTIHNLLEEGSAGGDRAQVEPWTPAKGESNKAVPAYLSFTSGTTSQPKGVCITYVSTR